jgi:predicted RNase H-like HicB family nuclease
MKNKEFYVVIERDEDGMYVGEVPQLKACYSQGETIDELIQNIREVIVMCLEEVEEQSTNEFIGMALLHKCGNGRAGS